MLRFRLGAAAVALALVTAAAPAQTQQIPDDWRTTPYKLVVVLHIQDHPLLTPVYRTGLEQELADALKRDLGPIADVEVKRSVAGSFGDPLMEDVVKNGWGSLDRATQDLNDKKVHLVRVLYQDGHYEVQARQVCGYTGLVSKFRRVQTSDRQWVSRVAALTVAQDFGMVGEFKEVSGSGGDVSVQLDIKGNTPQAPASVRIQGRDVFAIARILRGDGKLQGERVQDTVLTVTGAETGLTRLISRYVQPLRRERGLVKFRALKLGTQTAPLQLRIVDQKTGQPLPGHVVQVSSQGFDPGSMKELPTPTDALGRVRTTEVFQNVVCVKVLFNGRSRLVTPIPLLEDEIVEKGLAGTQQADDLAKFESSYRKWLRRLYAFNNTLDEENLKINKLLVDNNAKGAVEVAKAALPPSEAEIADLDRDLEAVKDEARAVGDSAKNLITDAESAIALIKDKKKGFEDFIQEQVSPTAAQTKHRRARILEEAGEPEQALALYKEALAEDKEGKLSPTARARIAKMEEAWKSKGKAHDEARNFILNTWDKLPVEELPKRLDDARRAASICVNNGDFLSLSRMLKADRGHNDRLNAALDRLKEAADYDDVSDKIAAVVKTQDELITLHRKIAEAYEKMK
jgi:tetratricopeptide (TPR) repeat protein